METGALHMIPFLSKELDLLGYPKLPYTTKRRNKVSKIMKSERNNSDFSDSDVENFEENDSEISFNSSEMMNSLISTCIRLVKDMKLSCQSDPDSNDYYKMRFMNSTLQKHVDSLRREVDEKVRIITDVNEKCRLLTIKLTQFESKVKFLEKEKLKILQQSRSDKDVMMHQKKKVEQDLMHLHKTLYQQTNLLDIKNLPKNFEIVQAKQPDFKKLWSEVKYSSANKKEEALKKAVCIFQRNNELILDENLSLKTLLFLTVDEINSLITLISKKMGIPCRVINEKEIRDIFTLDKGLQSKKYKECLWKQLKVFVNIIDCFDECHFLVGDNLFVSLNDITEKMKNLSGH